MLNTLASLMWRLLTLTKRTKGVLMKMTGSDLILRAAGKRLYDSLWPLHLRWTSMTR